jgi:hypothetical protein
MSSFSYFFHHHHWSARSELSYIYIPTTLQSGCPRKIHDPEQERRRGRGRGRVAS